MATFHLYELEGVAAQLLFSFQNGDAFTVAQTARELVLSLEQTLLLNLLQLAWLLSPFSDADAHIAKALEDQNTEAVLYALAAVAKSHTMPQPILEQTIFKPPHNPSAKLPPKTWTRFPKEWTLQMAGSLWWAVHAAIQKKHIDRAFRLSYQLLETQDVLLPFLTSHGVPHYFISLYRSVAPQLKHRVLLHAFGSLLESKTMPEPPADICRAYSNKRLGGRKGRTFYVTAAALNTWNIAPVPITRLQNEPVLIAEDTASNYWTTVWSTEGSLESDRLVFKDDAACEAFYEKHFPDDIPDEWSAEERAKSHGQTVNPDAPKNPWRQAFLLCFANA
jgi:hypothetical protein